MAQRSASAHPRGHSSVADDLDCTACGACCFSDEVDYIRVYAADLARMDERARGLTRAATGYRVMDFSGGRCAALQIDEAPPSFRCAIYEMRPDCCRWLVPGSAICLQMRAARNIGSR